MAELERLNGEFASNSLCAIKRHKSATEEFASKKKEAASVSVELESTNKTFDFESQTRHVQLFFDQLERGG